jgi:hypothetical protein
VWTFVLVNMNDSQLFTSISMEYSLNLLIKRIHDVKLQFLAIFTSDVNPRFVWLLTLLWYIDMCRVESEWTPYWKVGIQWHQLVSVVCLPFTILFRSFTIRDTRIQSLDDYPTCKPWLIWCCFLILCIYMCRLIEWRGSDQFKVMLLCVGVVKII